MSIIMTALAIAASAQATPPAQAPASKPAEHAQHQQKGQTHEAKACACCEHMAKGQKMACCEKHEKATSGDHAGHSAE
jgi:hypothetical protein